MADIVVPLGGTPYKQKLQQVGPDRYAREVYAHNIWSAAVAAGSAFVASSERITASLGQHVVGLIQNPSGSGKVVTVAQITTNIAADRMVVGDVMLNPTGNLPTNERTPFNMQSLVGGTETCVAKYFVGSQSDAASGGTSTHLTMSSHKGRTDIPIGLPIGPGASVSVSIPLGVLEAGDGAFTVYLTQEDISDEEL